MNIVIKFSMVSSLRAAWVVENCELARHHIVNGNSGVFSD